MRYNINFSSFDRKREKQKKLLGLLYIIVIAVLVFFALFGLKKSNDMLSEIDRIRNEAKAVEENIAKDLEQRRKFLSDEEVRVLTEKLVFYSSLYDNRFYITAFLTGLEEIIPAGVSLKNIDIDMTRKSFVLTGESLSPEGAVSFSKKIQDLNYIKNVEISKQSFQRLGDKKLLVNDFDIKGELY